MRALPFLLGLAVLALPSDLLALDEPPMELVHVTANTGFAAGGHVALRVGDYAYHFEVWPDGWLRLGRQRWAPFRLRYGTLENRGMHATELDLGEAERGRLHRDLRDLWSRQSADLARLDAFSTAVDWIAHREGAEPPELPGVGFFAGGRPDHPHAADLRDAVKRRLPEGQLASQRARVETALAAWRSGDDPETLRDGLLLRAALRALEEARGLAPGSLLDPEAGFDEPLPLAPSEQRHLERLSGDLEQTVARLLLSRRPDRGRPLLLAMARYQALRRSVEEQRLWFLDAVSGAEPIPELGDTSRTRPLLRRLAERASAGWRATRSAVLGQTLREPGYNDLEEAATGVHEMRAALTENRPIRMRALGRLIPARPGRIDAVPLANATTHLELPRARAREEQFRSTLATRYHYELVTRNCATELATLIGMVAPDAHRDGTSFIPALLSRRIRASGAAGEQRELPSHRHERVDRLAEREGRLRVALRESNTLTSTAYEGSLHDDTFLFFADGSPWLRPALGTANLAYGIGHAVAGLVSAPLDRGQRLRRGLEGAFYSLPELVGVSIRKGRYDLVPLDR